MIRVGRIRLALVSTVIVAGALGAVAGEPFGGVEFPSGIASFVDDVVAYEPTIKAGQPTQEWRVAARALGAPDMPCMPNSDCVVSLGDGGSITLRFVDNLLSASGDEKPDLQIFEIGADPEHVSVEVSSDGTEFTPVGTTATGGGVDLDAFGFDAEARITHVRLIDDPDQGLQSGRSVGADIDAVGAITSLPAIATALVAKPAIVDVAPGGAATAAPTLGTLTAMLTRADSGEAITGAEIVFAGGSTELCRATTGADGVASCTVDPAAELQAVLPALGYTATYAGSPTLMPSSADGALVAVNDAGLP